MSEGRPGGRNGAYVDGNDVRHTEERGDAGADLAQELGLLDLLGLVRLLSVTALLLLHRVAHMAAATEAEDAPKGGLADEVIDPSRVTVEGILDGLHLGCLEGGRERGDWTQGETGQTGMEGQRTKEGCAMVPGLKERCGGG